MIYKLRLVSDESEEFFRNIEIKQSQTFLDLHKAILACTGYSDGEICSFFMSDSEWERSTEITLMDMSDGDKEELRMMHSTRLEEFLTEVDQRMVYVFDFYSDRGFYVTLTAIKEEQKGAKYPTCTLTNGKAPRQLMLDDELADIINSSKAELSASKSLGGDLDDDDSDFYPTRGRSSSSGYSDDDDMDDFDDLGGGFDDDDEAFADDDDDDLYGGGGKSKGGRFDNIDDYRETI